MQIGQLTIRIHWLVLICLISTLGMFVSPGLWQLERADEKRALAQNLQLRASAAPVPLHEAQQSPLFGDQMRVYVQGHFEQDAPFLIPFQFYQGRAGYEVIMPLRLSDGTLALVSRGWLAPPHEVVTDGGSGSQLPEIPLIEDSSEGLQSEDQQGEGRQWAAQLVVPAVEIPPATVVDSQWPVRLARLNTEQAGRLLGEPVYPYVLRLEADQPGVLARHWSAPPVSTRTHIAYAVQWFVIALVVAMTALFMSCAKSQDDATSRRMKS